MSSFDEKKQFVTTCFESPTFQQTFLPRRYTLTHSDETGELFLTIGRDYAWHKINTQMRDEVLGEWKQLGNTLYFEVYVYLDNGEFDEQKATKRNEVFRRELPLALTAMRYGDRALFHQFPYLDNAFIVINFMSSYPLLKRQENWGTFSTYATR